MPSRPTTRSTRTNVLSQRYNQWGSLHVSPCRVFRHGERRIYFTIHVDDLLVVGADFDCRWFLKETISAFQFQK